MSANASTPQLVTPPPRLVRVRANQPSFREVTFQPGFNVVLAERTQESTKKDSRNGLGKTTLIEIITFCLGAKIYKEGLGSEALKSWAFTLDMTLFGKHVSVTRETADAKRVYIDGDTSDWPTLPVAEKDSARMSMKVDDWTAILGMQMFGIPLTGFAKANSPTFRSVISYFIRRSKDAYSTPFEHFRKQLEWDKQVNNAFLLGLAWEDASEWQNLREKKSALDDLRKAQASGLIGDMIQGSLGELEAAKVRLQTVVRDGESGLSSFKVHPQYSDLEQQANVLSKKIIDTANKIVAERQLLGNYQEGLASIPETDVGEVVAIYEEVGVLFPDRTRRRLEDAKDFHLRLIDNRNRFLASEVTRLQQSLEKAEEQQRLLDEERARVLGVLQSYGALEQYTLLQRQQSENVARLKAVEAQITTLKKLEEGKSDIRIEEELLRKKTRNDLDDRKEQRERAIKIFNANSEVLYDSPANLVIDVGTSGFKFDIEILRSASQGVGNMKILCYDLMLAELWAKRSPNPGILIHDSMLFDGVDERQIAHALELAEKKSRELGFQYICTMNSDMIPEKDLGAGFDLKSFVRMTLTDRTPDGSLLGIRY